jgi:uncharacterized protein (TIGR02118 family)
MLKFMVVLTRREGTSALDFRRYFKEVHEPLEKQIPGLKRYVQNFVVDEARRKRPAWDAIIELYFDNWTSMESAWASAEGRASTDDLTAFADVERSGWSVVEEAVIVGGKFE